MDISVIEHASTLTVVNARPEFERAAIWLGDFAAAVGLPDDLSSRLLVVLDEVLSNVVHHGLAAAMEGEREIRLCVRLRPETVELEVVDDGPAFDPTTVVSVTPAADRRSMERGGRRRRLGFHVPEATPWHHRRSADWWRRAAAVPRQRH